MKKLKTVIHNFPSEAIRLSLVRDTDIRTPPNERSHGSLGYINNGLHFGNQTLFLNH